MFPLSSHVRFLNLHESDDLGIWNFAKQNHFTIVTQDSDFNEWSILYGFPPKIVWLKTGNTSTDRVIKLIRDNFDEILSFENNPKSGCLELY